MTNGLQFHHIQKSIILSLASKSPARFSDLQPPRLPNNTFSYHLKKLLDSGYIELTEKGYIPTRKALKLVAFGSGKNSNESSPTIMSTIFVTNSDDEVLLVNRDNKPFQGWYGLPSGLIHLGETLQEAAHRELFEKTTIVAEKDLEPVGVLDFRYISEEGGDVFVHALAFIYKYEYPSDKQQLNDTITKYGQLSWSNLGRSHILPEVFKIKEMIESNNFSHESVSFIEPSHMPVLEI